MLRTLVQPSHLSDVHGVYNQQQAPRSGEFLHNGRLWLLCLPSLLLLLDFGGGVMLGAAALGLMVTYIFDALDQTEACFVSFWVTVGAQVVGHAVGSFLVLGMCVRGFGLAVVSATFALLLGVWGSLQLSWLPEQEPGLARLGERLLFALLPVPCAALPTWGAAALCGASCTPWVLSASLGASYCLLGGGAPSSFPPSSFSAPAADAEPAPTGAAHRRGGAMPSHRQGGRAPHGRHGQHEQGVLELAADTEGSAAHAAAWVALPALYYAVLHRPTLLQPAAWPHHRAALLGLVAGASLVVAALPAPWGNSAAALRARALTQVGAMLALVLCAQQALALSPHRAAAIGAEPPYDQLFVCGALAAPVLLVTLRRQAFISRDLAEPLSALVAAVGSGCACAALALPKVYMLCALGASFSGVRAATHSDWPSLLACALCVLGLFYGLLHHTLGFVPHHSFGHAEAALGVGSMAAALLLLQALGALCVCCTVRRELSGLRGAALLAHALLLARVEMALRADDPGTNAETYPLPLLALSVAGGLLLCERLQCRGSPPPPPTLWWLLLAVHGGRGALLLVGPSPDAYARFESDEQALLFAATTLAAALSQPLHMQLLRRHGRLSATSSAAVALRLGFLAAATMLAHTQLVERVLSLAVQRPAPSLPLGASLMLFAFGGRPMCSELPPPLGPTLRRVCALVGACGALVAALQPPLLGWELLDSIAFTLLHPTASYSYGTTPRLLLWPPHLLLLLALAALAALLGLLPLRNLPPAAQLACCAAFGAAAALCGCGALLPLERSLFLAHAAAAALASAFMGMVIWPAQLARSARAPAVLLAGCLALFPCGLVLQVRAFGSMPRGPMLAALAMHRAVWLAGYAGVCGVGALLLKLQVTRGDAPPAAAAAAAAGGGGVRRPSASALQARAAHQQRRLQAARLGAAWMAPLGNLACVGAVVLGQATLVLHLDGSARGGVLLSPLLLLLHPHPPLARLHHANRYAPCMAFSGIALGAAALLEARERLRVGLLPAMRGVLLFCCAAPSIALCCKFVYDRRRVSETLVFVLAPLNLVPLLLAWSTAAFRDLGAAGLLAAALHMVLATRAKSEGLKYI